MAQDLVWTSHEPRKHRGRGRLLSWKRPPPRAARWAGPAGRAACQEPALRNFIWLSLTPFKILGNKPMTNE